MRIVVTSVLVDDQEKALRFYSDLLGLPVTDTVDFGRQFGVTSATGQDPNGYLLQFPARGRRETSS